MPLRPVHLAAAAVTALMAPLTSAPARAEAPAPYLDDASGFYDVENFEQSVNDTPTTFWALKGSVRVVGEVAERSVLRMVIRSDGKVLGEVRCETRSNFNKVDKRTLPHVFADDCSDRKQRFTETGEVEVEWHLIDGDTDADTVLGTHRIMVRLAPNTDAGSMKPWYPHFFVDRHGEVLSTVLYQRPAGWHDYVSGASGRPAGSNVDILLSAAPSWGGDDATNGSWIRCAVDGERVDLKTRYDNGNMSGDRTDAVRVSQVDATYAVSVLPNPAGDNPRVVQDHFVFRRYYLRLPLSYGDAKSELTATPMKPGVWECDWRSASNQSLRGFRWTVGADGRVVPHAEQTEGGLRLFPGAVAIETFVPPGNQLDFRLDAAAPEARAWSGRGLRTAAMRDRAKELKSVGDPVPKLPAAKGGAKAPAGKGRGR